MAKDSRTSKTARVMSLLSKKPDSTAVDEAAEANNAPAAPPIVASMAPDAAVSAQIKDALEGALEREIGTEASAPQPQPIPEPEPQPAPAPQPEPEAGVKFQDPPTNPGYINVMQVLVEERAPKYVKMFGLCSCERCMEDVKAYTLNHLSPKYVVMEPGDRIPRFTVYEGKFASDITAQLLQACKVVMERPHHSR